MTGRVCTSAMIIVSTGTLNLGAAIDEMSDLSEITLAVDGFIGVMDNNIVRLKKY